MGPRRGVEEASKAEACCWCCSNCCVLYSTLGIILMSSFGYLVGSKSVAFQIASAQALSAGKEEWDFAGRARICYITAVCYAVTLALALFSMQSIKAARKAREDLVA
eukprot:TRINITY_DN70928_c0_g1_i1.p1 TRINITY_DN70928_c0_g1~~TRINITY_DN70928_c0_g1_i1.p1  ORF type:complete len:116 (+),score=22.83 TRINITY_DN70928_c0_g1_i1:29-349(+)